MCAVLCSKLKRDHRRVDVDWTSLIMRVRSGCEVDDLQVFSFALHRSVPMRNYSAENYHRSFNLCRFHATPCARSSHARADMHAIAGEVDAKLEEISTFPCQRVITQPKIITDPLAFADSMPHHARARPMRARTCTPPLEKWMRSWKRRFTGLQFCPPPLRANA
jgi:hypothetical protein